MQVAEDRPATTWDEPIGFIGLGIMGRPMALNLARAGVPLIVWNRSPEASEALREAGATVAEGVEDVFSKARTVICMLVNEAALDAVLKRGTPAFGKLVSGHIVISMGSTPPDYSRALGTDIVAAGGRYVEAPVSGSSKPAETGQLVALLGGDPHAVAEITPLLAPMCRDAVACGAVGDALLIKLSVNLFLNTLLAGLAEAVHFTQRHGLDLNVFKTAVDSGPMSSEFTRLKLPKLVSGDFSLQTATSDAFKSASMIAEAARAAGLATPVLDLARDLYGESEKLGNGRRDAVSVITAIEARTDALPRVSP